MVRSLADRTFQLRLGQQRVRPVDDVVEDVRRRAPAGEAPDMREEQAVTAGATGAYHLQKVKGAQF